MSTFSEFVTKKEREAKKHLEIIGKILEQGGMKVRTHLDAEDEPYLYIMAPTKKLSFDGVRVYSIGSQLAYRVAKEEKTEPYGKAYPIDVEDMWEDLLGDHFNEEKAGQTIASSVRDEIKKFFDQSEKAEAKLRAGEIGGAGDPLGKVIVRSTGTDYSSMVYTKSNG